jgi:Domain of unknown function (DUF397)
MEDNDMTQSWRTSSYTGNGGGNCVEVAHAPSVVMVRDTKDRAGAVLALNAQAWEKFTSGLK